MDVLQRSLEAEILDREDVPDGLLERNPDGFAGEMFGYLLALRTAR